MIEPLLIEWGLVDAPKPVVLAAAEPEAPPAPEGPAPTITAVTQGAQETAAVATEQGVLATETAAAALDDAGRGGGHAA